jgi:hypothetical protein
MLEAAETVAMFIAGREIDSSVEWRPAGILLISREATSLACSFAQVVTL